MLRLCCMPWHSAGIQALSQANCLCSLQKMVVHAMALQKGATYKDVSPVLAEEPAKEDGGILGKLTGLFRST